MNRASAADKENSAHVHQKRIILVLCLFAGLRVFFFSAGFPLYNNVDEHCHFDLVYKYSRGQLPRGLENFGRESARLLALYHSWEFLTRPRDVVESWISRPLWTYEHYEIKPVLDRFMAFWVALRNHEAVQPPLYYAVAGAWYRLGELLGLREGQGVYWVRFFNVSVVACLVWLSYIFATRFYPSNPFLHFSVPLIIAFLPQDLFYSISNGVLSPLSCGLAFYFALGVAQGTGNGKLYCLFCGLCTGAAILTAYTNAPILLVFGWAMLARLRSDLRNAVSLWAALRCLSPMVFVPLVLIGGWLAVNFALTGHLTNMGEYLSHAGWRTKRIGEMFSHPIFTPSGILLFWRELLSTYFRGEFSWRGVWIADARADAFYWASSLIFLLIAAYVIGKDATNRSGSSESRVGLASLAYFAVSLFILILMSIRYDFGHWYYPSRHHPYFISGRLISGALIPFMSLYMLGMDWMFHLLKIERARKAAAIAIAAFMLLSEIRLSVPAFRSVYNWFHLS